MFIPSDALTFKAFVSAEHCSLRERAHTRSFSRSGRTWVNPRCGPMQVSQRFYRGKESSIGTGLERESIRNGYNWEGSQLGDCDVTSAAGPSRRGPALSSPTLLYFEAAALGSSTRPPSPTTPPASVSTSKWLLVVLRLSGPAPSAHRGSRSR